MPLNAIAYETERIATRASVSAPPSAVAALTDITKRYGTTLALDGLSLSLHPGEVVALLGPNGAGKSTAVRLLLGLIAPTSGITQVFGSDPRNATTRTRVGAMLQVAASPRPSASASILTSSAATIPVHSQWWTSFA